VTTFLIQIDRWEHVRDRFTDEERASLNAAISGHTICPQGVTVELLKLPASLADKIRDTLSRPVRRP